MKETEWLFEAHAVEHLLDFGEVACHSGERNVFYLKALATNAVERGVLDHDTFGSRVLVVTVGKVVLCEGAGQNSMNWIA